MPVYRPILTPLAKQYAASREKRRQEEKEAEQERYRRALDMEARQKQEQETERRRRIEDERLAREREQYSYEQQTRLPAQYVKDQQTMSMEQSQRQSELSKINLGQSQIRDKDFQANFEIDKKMERGIKDLELKENQMRLKELNRKYKFIDTLTDMGLAPELAETANTIVAGAKQGGITGEELINRLKSEPEITKVFGPDLLAIRQAINVQNKADEKEKTVKEIKERETKIKELQAQTANIKAQGKKEVENDPKIKQKVIQEYTKLLKAYNSLLIKDSEEADKLKELIQMMETEYPWLSTKKAEKRSNPNAYGEILKKYNKVHIPGPQQGKLSEYYTGSRPGVY